MTNIEKNTRYDTYSLAMKNLIQSKIVYKVENINKYAVPLKIVSNSSEFKLYFNDCEFISHILIWKWKY